MGKQRNAHTSLFFDPVGRLELDLVYIQQRMRRLGIVNWSQLARALKMFPEQLHFTLQTRRCRLQTMEKLCRVLRSDVSDILIWHSELEPRPKKVSEVNPPTVNPPTYPEVA